MSQLKKALQQLSNEKEFYAQGFLMQNIYLKWKQGIKTTIDEEFELLVQTDFTDEERLLRLLKKQPNLVKAILSREVLVQIKPWYQHHSSADFKRQKRQ